MSIFKATSRLILHHYSKDNLVYSGNYIYPPDILIIPDTLNLSISHTPWIILPPYLISL
jgi:hypothetical protein